MSDGKWTTALSRSKTRQSTTGASHLAKTLAPTFRGPNAKVLDRKPSPPSSPHSAPPPLPASDDASFKTRSKSWRKAINLLQKKNTHITHVCHKSTPKHEVLIGTQLGSAADEITRAAVSSVLVAAVRQALRRGTASAATRLLLLLV